MDDAPARVRDLLRRRDVRDPHLEPGQVVLLDFHRAAQPGDIVLIHAHGRYDFVLAPTTEHVIAVVRIP